MNDLFKLEPEELSHAKRFMQDLRQSKSIAGNSWSSGHMEDFVARWLTDYSKQTRRAKSKKADLDERATQVYELYPRKIAALSAKRAITGALASGVSLTHLVQQTAFYARCVSKWPPSYRKLADGGDRCPHPATWYNRGSYNDDPKEWFGPLGAPKDHVRAVDAVHPEPVGWRTEFPECVYPTWEEVPQSSKAHICAAMKLGNQFAVPDGPASRPSLAFPDR